jgi:hypothetical protein
MHTGRGLERAVAPNATKEATLVLDPIDNSVPSVESSTEAAVESGGENKAAGFQHGNCPVRHRSTEAAAKCRNP